MPERDIVRDLVDGKRHAVVDDASEHVGDDDDGEPAGVTQKVGGDHLA